MSPPAVARRMWRALETLHMTVYFTPEPREAYRRAGLRGGWMGYFASRSAAMGPVPAEVVLATFYNFHPRMVRRAIPDAWGFAPPERVLAARLEGADAALRRLLGDWAGGPEAAEAAALARRAMEGQDPAGRPLFAAHAAGGLEAHVLAAGAGQLPGSFLREYRGWSEEEWAGGAARLQARGWLAGDGSLTEAGRAGRAARERRTDDLAAAPWAGLGPAGCDRLLALLAEPVRRVVEAGGIPFPNPVGLPLPSTPQEHSHGG
jgi:hypothetical protein